LTMLMHPPTFAWTGSTRLTMIRLKWPNSKHCFQPSTIPTSMYSPRRKGKLLPLHQAHNCNTLVKSFPRDPRPCWRAGLVGGSNAGGDASNGGWTVSSWKPQRDLLPSRSEDTLTLNAEKSLKDWTKNHKRATLRRQYLSLPLARAQGCASSSRLTWWWYPTREAAAAFPPRLGPPVANWQRRRLPSYGLWVCK